MHYRWSLLKYVYCLTDENVHTAKEWVLKNQHSSLRELIWELNESVWEVLVDVLCMRRVTVRHVPKERIFLSVSNAHIYATCQTSRNPKNHVKVNKGMTWVFEVFKKENA